MIAEAAYFRAKQRGFAGDPIEHWLAAEAEINERLKTSLNDTGTNRRKRR